MGVVAMGSGQGCNGKKVLTQFRFHTADHRGKVGWRNVEGVVTSLWVKLCVGIMKLLYKPQSTYMMFFNISFTCELTVKLPRLETPGWSRNGVRISVMEIQNAV